MSVLRHFGMSTVGAISVGMLAHWGHPSEIIAGTCIVLFLLAGFDGIIEAINNSKK